MSALDEEPLPEPPIVEGSEDALADEFAGLYRHLFRFTPGMGWMRGMSTHWVPDALNTRYDLARGIARIAAMAEAKDANRKSLCSAKTIHATVSLASSDPRLVLAPEHWDADPFVLNTPRGPIDLRTGRAAGDRPWPFDGAYFTKCTQVAPDFKASCPVWDRFLADVFCGDREMIEFVQRLVGYTYTGDRREQKIFFLHGAGGNGKNTFVDFVSALAGNYAIKLPAQVLLQTPFQSHPTELAQLRGKRLAISSELEAGQHWAESRIKELTGDDFLRARFMRQDFFEFRQTQKHVVMGNHKPRLRGGDAALARRFVLVPFTARFTGARRDSTLPERLRAEAPAVLAWTIQGAVKWHAEGLAIPRSVEAASHEYMQENDDLSMWMDECCVRVPAARCKATLLYGNYLAWLKVRGQHAPSMKSWADAMSVVPGLSKRKSHGSILYEGIGLVDEQLEIGGSE
jgi:putative DNA primase/helicase